MEVEDAASEQQAPPQGACLDQTQQGSQAPAPPNQEAGRELVLMSEEEALEVALTQAVLEIATRDREIQEMMIPRPGFFNLVVGF